MVDLRSVGRRLYIYALNYTLLLRPSLKFAADWAMTVIALNKLWQPTVNIDFDYRWTAMLFRLLIISPSIVQPFPNSVLMASSHYDLLFVELTKFLTFTPFYNMQHSFWQLWFPCTVFILFCGRHKCFISTGGSLGSSKYFRFLEYMYNKKH